MHDDLSSFSLPLQTRLIWHDLVATIDASIHTLRHGVPDPLWWGSARVSYDAQVEEIICELLQAKREILLALEHPGC
ncbi:hypothetical protein [Aurantimicrobium sp. MWH-Uga1]|uniref:hypothetical protein n=1 Tax=Aurantimicrobium sp. MWH-Uga1 TaxID=2079575 RepID=UPI000DF05074|nr:hypothetical protein [Aurantimicrobium sp. MWH-Uga1]AXE53774.1 hypothetical protein AURUGA1_00056 [Aurantimicrobium sp. MWH-Uga1]